MSDVLLVPAKCHFFHKERMDMCLSRQQWQGEAKEVSQAMSLDISFKWLDFFFHSVSLFLTPNNRDTKILIFIHDNQINYQG